MNRSLSLNRGLRVLAALLPLTFAAGCYEPLALKDPYFVPGKGNAAAHRADALQTVRYNRALQAARHACPPAASKAASPGRAANAAAAAREAALARLCETLSASSPAAQGGSANAYRRWVEDGVRPLPEASATAAGAAGG